MTDSAFPTLLESLKTSPSAPGRFTCWKLYISTDRVSQTCRCESRIRKTRTRGPESWLAVLEVSSPCTITRLSILIASYFPRDEGILDALHNWASNKKSGYERESAPIAFQAFAIVIGAPIAPLLLPSLPILFDLYADKGDVVVAAAKSATKAILKLFPPEAARIVCRALEEVLSSNKWQTKVGALDAIRGLVSSAKEQIANEIATVLPVIEKSLHDTKKEVSSAANKCAVALCGTLDNADIVSHIPALVKCMGNPDNVPAVIKSLSSTTFVAEVKAPALAVLVPLLLRALNDRSMEVQRRTVVVIDNLVKLVRDPTIAATYLSPLVDGTERIAKGAAFPEVRAFANTALNTLLKSGASSSAPPASPRDLDAERISALAGLLTLLPSELHHDPASFPNGPHTPFHPVLGQTLDFSASLVADLIFASEFYNNKAWARAAGTPLSPWLAHVSDSLTGPEYAERVREHFLAIDEAKRAPPEEESADEGELLCDTIFSLAYGALLLLSHTRLKLYRGRRYGILGPNGSGKSTLMRQLRDGKVENFPPQDQLRCLMVEHALQGEITNMSIIDFIASGMWPRLLYCLVI
jgi:elongation factor 3